MSGSNEKLRMDMDEESSTEKMKTDHDDMGECPMKRKRMEEEKMKKGMTEKSTETDASHKPYVTSNTRKITKDILEEEEKKAQSRINVDDDDEHEEL